MDYIRDAQDKEFWKTGDIPYIEKLRIELRDLMKFLDFEETPIYYTSFTDEIDPHVTEHQLVYAFNDLSERFTWNTLIRLY